MNRTLNPAYSLSHELTSRAAVSGLEEAALTGSPPPPPLCPEKQQHLLSPAGRETHLSSEAHSDDVKLLQTERSSGSLGQWSVSSKYTEAAACWQHLSKYTEPLGWQAFGSGACPADTHPGNKQSQRLVSECPENCHWDAFSHMTLEVKWGLGQEERQAVKPI